MMQFHLLLVGVLVGAVLLAGFSNKKLKDQLVQANQSLTLASNTETYLKACRVSLDEQKRFSEKCEEEKTTLTAKAFTLENQIAALKKQAEAVLEKDKEIAGLKQQVEQAARKETELKAQVNEAEKALDSLAKEAEARRAREAKEAEEARKTKEAKEVQEKKPDAEHAEKKTK